MVAVCVESSFISKIHCAGGLQVEYPVQHQEASWGTLTVRIIQQNREQCGKKKQRRSVVPRSYQHWSAERAVVLLYAKWDVDFN
jgi:hypothetical protein